MSGGLLDRHVGFLDALRGAGVGVSLAEGLDAVAALRTIGWHERATVREAYAATLVKRSAQRPVFDALFDLYFPPLVGDGAPDPAGPSDPSGPEGGERAAAPSPRDDPEALADLRARLAQALGAGDEAQLAQLAREAMARFGAIRGRQPGLSSWSAYTTLQRVSPTELVEQVVRGLSAGRADGAAPGPREAVDGVADGGAAAARRRVERAVGTFALGVEQEARRRIGEEKGTEHVSRVVVRPTVDRIDFLTARRTDLEAMRREIYPLARRLASRLTREQHAGRPGALDVRRTVRASMSTGGVPLSTRHRPRRPHRTELAVLCDVSGSVAGFAQFTLMLVLALREQFAAVRAFTFVDTVHEVTHHLEPGADLLDVLEALAADTAQAATWGRTHYGRALSQLAREHPDAVGPRTSLLVLGDARSNHSDLALPVLRELAGTARHAWWLNPEPRERWNTGDSAARAYGEVVAMVECRTLGQLGELVHDLAGAAGRPPRG